MRDGEGPCDDDEKGDGDEDDGCVEAGALDDGLALAAEELAATMDADGEVGGGGVAGA